MSQNENSKPADNKVVDFENKQKIEIPDQNYRLAEMADAMDQSIANAKKVANEQALLMNIVTKSDKAKDFKDFVKQCEQQVNNINAQVTTLEIRSSLLKQVVEKCNDNEEISRVVSMLLKALGVFEQQK